MSPEGNENILEAPDPENEVKQYMRAAILDAEDAVSKLVESGMNCGL